MVANSLLVIILLRVILPLAVILAIVSGVTHFGFKQAYGIGLFERMRIEKDVKQVIAEFMEAGEARNVEEAYGCFDFRSATEEGIAGLIERSYDEVFAGYESLTINSISRKSDSSMVVRDPPAGDGEGGGIVAVSWIDICHVSGDITYTTGYKAFGKVSCKVVRFEASMVDENGIWKIRHIRIGDNLLVTGHYLR